MDKSTPNSRSFAYLALRRQLSRLVQQTLPAYSSTRAAPAMSSQLNDARPFEHTSRVMHCWLQERATADGAGQSLDIVPHATQLCAQSTGSVPSGKKPQNSQPVKDDASSTYCRRLRKARKAAQGRNTLFDTVEAKYFDGSAFQPIDLSTIDPRDCIYEREAEVFNRLLAHRQLIYNPRILSSILDTLCAGDQSRKQDILDDIEDSWRNIAGAGRRAPDIHTVILADQTQALTHNESPYAQEAQGIDDEDQVSTLLREGVEQPVFVLGKPAQYRPTVDEFCRTYKDWRDVDGHPFELHKQRASKIRKAGLNAEGVAVDDMERERSQPCTSPLLPNLTHECWTPSYIQQHDLLHQIHVQRGEARDYRFNEFAIAGSDKSLTMPHVAKLGAATWMAPVIGGKLIGFFAGGPEHRRLLYSMTDFDVTRDGYNASFPSFGTHWVNLAGDRMPVLILPPGEPQFSMGNGVHVCLYGHIYVKELLHLTWRAIATELFDFGLKHKLYTPSDFDNLTLIVSEHFGPMFNDHDRAASCPELGQLVKRYTGWKLQKSGRMIESVQCDEPTLEALEKFMSTAADVLKQAKFGEIE